ncbi:hypothetical protein [Mycoplasma buteonis]|uniref:hypothetical protein n=1 Tax=Mycoplasma buteonis TaxID=171280 RepID=UPI000568A555|nr:hypothetical protein [Mycoplasma buteonis]
MNKWNYKKYLSLGAVVSPLILTTSCIQITNNNSNGFAKQAAKSDYKLIKRFQKTSRFEFVENSFQNKLSIADKQFISEHLPSFFDSKEKIDHILRFRSDDFYKDYELVGYEPYDQEALLVVYFKNNAYKKLHIAELDFDLEPELDFVILQGFKKAPLEDSKVLTLNNKATPNMVGIAFENNENNLISANGSFVNYLATQEPQEYPTTWFLLSAGHPFFDKMDGSSFDLNVFNTDGKITTKARVIQDGRNQWDHDISYFKKMLPEKYQNLDIKPFLDYSILEVKFNSVEEAKKYTAKSFNISYLTDNLLQDRVGFYDFQENKAVYKEIERKHKYIETRAKSLDSEIIEFSNFFYNTAEISFLKNQKVFEINGEYFIDLSILQPVRDTKLGAGSSGVLAFNDDNYYLKVAENQNDGLWILTSTAPEIRYVFELPFKFELLGGSEELYEEVKKLTYDIFANLSKESKHQTKSFIKTFKKLYPNGKLGIEAYYTDNTEK